MHTHAHIYIYIYIYTFASCARSFVAIDPVRRLSFLSELEMSRQRTRSACVVHAASTSSSSSTSSTSSTSTSSFVFSSPPRRNLALKNSFLAVTHTYVLTRPPVRSAYRKVHFGEIDGGGDEHRRWWGHRTSHGGRARWRPGLKTRENRVGASRDPGKMVRGGTCSVLTVHDFHTGSTFRLLLLLFYFFFFLSFFRSFFSFVSTVEKNRGGAHRYACVLSSIVRSLVRSFSR